MRRSPVVDSFRSFEDNLLSTGKLDSTEVTTKSFIYSPIGVGEGGKKGPPTPKIPPPPPPPLPLSTVSTGEGRLSGGTAQGQGQGQGHRGRVLSQEAPPSAVAAVVSSKTSTAVGTAESSTVASATAATATGAGGTGTAAGTGGAAKMSRSGSDSHLQQNHRTTAHAHTPPIYIGCNSLLPLSVSNQQDSLEMLGASLDLQEENGVFQDGYAYDVDDQDSSDGEQGAERGSIAMSSKPFRVSVTSFLGNALVISPISII